MRLSADLSKSVYDDSRASFLLEGMTEGDRIIVKGLKRLPDVTTVCVRLSS